MIKLLYNDKIISFYNDIKVVLSTSLNLLINPLNKFEIYMKFFLLAFKMFSIKDIK